MISSVNVTKFTEAAELVTFTEETLNGQFLQFHLIKIFLIKDTIYCTIDLNLISDRFCKTGK